MDGRFRPAKTGLPPERHPLCMSQDKPLHPRGAMKEQISNFANHLAAERGLSVNTISAYRRDLHQFAQFTDDREISIERLAQRDVVAFLGSLRRAALTESSISRKLSAI